MARERELRVKVVGDSGSGQKAMRDFDRSVDESARGLQDFGRNAAVAFAAVGAAVGTAIGAATIVGFRGALEREAASAELGSSLGLSEDQAAKAGQIAGRLYASNFGESVKAAGDAVAAVIQGGLAGIGDSAADIEALTAKVITFAQVFRVDVGEAVRTVSALLKSGLAPDARTAIDQITAAMQRVPEAVRTDVLDALEEYSPFFAQLGIKSEQAMAALVRASQGGRIAIDKTGDALKELVIRAQDGSAKTAEALQALGLNVGQIEQGFARGGQAANDALNQIIEALVRIDDPVKQAQIGVALLGTPFEDLALNAIPTLKALQQGLGETAGAADMMVESIGGTNAAKLETFKRSMETNVSNVVATAITWIERLPGPLQNAAAALVGLAGAGASLTPIIGGLTPLLTASSVSLAGIVGVASGAVAALALIAGAVYLLVQNWDTVRAATGAVVDFLSATVGPAIGAFAGFVREQFANLAAWTRENWDAIQEAIGHVVSLVSAIVTQFVDLVLAVWRAWGDEITAIAQIAWDQVRAVVEAAVAIVASLIELGLALINGDWAEAWDSIKAILAEAWDLIVETVRNSDGLMREIIKAGILAIVDLMASLPGLMLSALGDLGGLLYGAGQDLILGMIGGIRSMAGRLADAAVSVARSAVNAVKGFLGIGSPSKLFMGFGQNIGEGLALGIGQGERGVAQAARGLAGATLAGVPGLADRSLSVLDDARRTRLAPEQPGRSTVPAIDYERLAAALAAAVAANPIQATVSSRQVAQGLDAIRRR